MSEKAYRNTIGIGSASKRARRFVTSGAILAGLLLAATPVLAQGWWPWSDSQPERPPIPQAPVYDGAPQPPPGQQPADNWSTHNPICLKLEQRLVQEGQRTGQSGNQLPQIESDIREATRAYQSAEGELERRRCYEHFLFSKTLRRTRTCVNLAREKEQAKRRRAELESQRQQIVSSSSRSYRDEIIRELARNNCGPNYVQEARRMNRGPFSGIWQDEGGQSFSNNWNRYGGSSATTYRTVCVRLCDGYYFPISFSTLPSHFDEDANQCQSRCAAPTQLYYYQNPGQTVNQSMAFGTQEPYTNLKTAFLYRKQLVGGCSCKETEYAPEPVPASGQQAQGIGAGWEARSEWEASSQQPDGSQ